MALINCSGCGHRISSKARICPKCGQACVQEVRAPGVIAAARIPDHVPPTFEFPVADRLPETPPPPVQEDTREEWYNVATSGRTGPVTLGALRGLAADGVIDEQTSVWKAGMPDWIPLSRYQEAAPLPAAEPPPQEPILPPRWSLWAFALAPAWGMVAQITITEAWVAITHKHLAFYAQFWWIVVIANLLVWYLDLRILGPETPTIGAIGKSPGLLLPSFLFKREDGRRSAAATLWVWLGSLLLWIAACHYLNDWYTSLAGK